MNKIKKTLYIIILLLPILAIYLSPRVIKAKKFTCSSQFGPCSEEIVGNLEEAKGESVHQAKKKIENSLETNIHVNEFSLHYKIPNELEVELLIKKPIYGLRQGASSKVAEVVSTGEVLNQKETTSLPTLIVEDEVPNPGENVDQDTLFALNLLYDVSSQHRIDQARVENESLVIDLADSIEVIFPLEGDRQVLTGSLNLILNQLNSESEDFRINNTEDKLLDLRLKNPVLR